MASECKKFINVFLAVFITIIGATLIALVAAGYALISDARTKLVDLAFVNYYATAIFVAAILLVILLTFGGICGVAGSLKSNAYCLLFYAIISIVCAIWFLAVAIAALKAPDAYFGSDNCTSADYFTQLNNYTLAAAQNGVCQTGCQCYLTATSAGAYNATYLATLTYSSADSTKAVKNQDCTNAWNTGSSPTGGDTVMAYLETFLSCTSWCDSTTYPLTIYRFTNVNNGIPAQFCYPLIRTYVTGYSRTAYIIGFIMTAIAALSFFCGLWLRSDVREDEQNPPKHMEGPSQMRLGY